MAFKLGLDFYNVITQFPNKFGSLADDILKAGGQVAIISAIGSKKLEEFGGLEKYREMIVRYNIPNTGIFILTVEPWIAPQAKLEECRRLNIDIMIDDRADIVDHLFTNGILALRCNVNEVQTRGDLITPVRGGTIRPGFLKKLRKENHG